MKPFSNLHQQSEQKSPKKFQMKIFLTKSLTGEGHIEIFEEDDNYRANGIDIGTLYFKLLMSKAVVDTTATARHLRENLTSIESCMTSENSNIESFNLYAKENNQSVKAIG